MADIDKLLDDLNVSRKTLQDWINQLEAQKNVIVKLFPEKLDYRTGKWILEEKVKTLSSFYSTLLSMRQEVNKTITQEIEIRRKIQSSSKRLDEDVDISELIDAMEDEMLRKKRERMQESNKDKKEKLDG